MSNTIYIISTIPPNSRIRLHMI